MIFFVIGTHSKEHWWFTPEGWKRNPESLCCSSNHERIRGGKVRAIRKAKRLALLAGTAYLVEWHRIRGKNYAKEIFFEWKKP